MRVFRHGVWLIALALAASCSRKAATIEVTPTKVKIYGLGRTQRLAGRLVDKKGQPLETGSPNWSSSKEDVVSVDPNGNLTAKGQGRAMVTAAYESLKARVPVEVLDVKTMEVSPASARMIGPAGTQFALQAILKDSKEKTVAIMPAWTSADPKIVTVSSDGLLTSIAPGTTTILAKLGELQSASEISVEIRPIARLEIRPATALVRVGDSQHFEVIAYGPDGKVIEGASATFHSSDPAVAVLDGNGRASGIAPGTATIQAKLAGVSAEATLLVN